jgi:hypothetical protein
MRRDWIMIAPLMSMSGFAWLAQEMLGGACNAELTAGHRVAAGDDLATRRSGGPAGTVCDVSAFAGKADMGQRDLRRRGAHPVLAGKS